MANESEAAVKWLETATVTYLQRRFRPPSHQPFLQFKSEHDYDPWHCGMCRRAMDRGTLIVVGGNAK